MRCMRGEKIAATFASEYQLAVTHLGFVQNKRSFIWFGHGWPCMWFWLKAELCWFSQYRRASALSFTSLARSLFLFLLLDLMSVESVAILLPPKKTTAITKNAD